MASNDIIREVSHHIDYYFRYKRLEDAFDLSGPLVPVLKHPPQKQMTLIHVPSLHDRSLKHFFSHPMLRVHLSKLSAMESENFNKKRHKEVRRLLRQRSYSAGNRLRNIPDTETRLISKQNLKRSGSPTKSTITGAYPVINATVPSCISKTETDRIVNLATRILLKNESVNLRDTNFRTTASGTKLQSLPYSYKKASPERKGGSPQRKTKQEVKTKQSKSNDTRARPKTAPPKKKSFDDQRKRSLSSRHDRKYSDTVYPSNILTQTNSNDNNEEEGITEEPDEERFLPFLLKESDKTDTAKASSSESSSSKGRKHSSTSSSRSSSLTSTSSTQSKNSSQNGKRNGSQLYSSASGSSSKGNQSENRKVQSRSSSSMSSSKRSNKSDASGSPKILTKKNYSSGSSLKSNKDKSDRSKTGSLNDDDQNERPSSSSSSSSSSTLTEESGNNSSRKVSQSSNETNEIKTVSFVPTNQEDENRGELGPGQDTFDFVNPESSTTNKSMGSPSGEAETPRESPKNEDPPDEENFDRRDIYRVDDVGTEQIAENEEAVIKNASEMGSSTSSASESSTEDSESDSDSDSDSTTKDKEPEVIEDANDSLSFVNYIVTVTTGSFEEAATCAPVKLHLYGNIGCSSELELSRSNRNDVPFRSGQTDEFIVKCRKLGDIERIDIGHRSSLEMNAWFVERVSVHDPVAKRIYYFNCKEWFSVNSPDARTIRTLKVTADGPS